MRGLQFSTEDTLEGPWLLDVNALKELDLTIAKHWDLLEARRNQLLDLAVEDEYRKYEEQISISANYAREQLEIFRRSHPIYSVSYLQLSIRYKKSYYVCGNFESAFRERSLIDNAPEGFGIEFGSGDVKCRIELSEKDGLWISISPEDLPESQELYLDIYQWAMRHQAPYWQRLWGRIANQGIGLYIAVAVIMSLAFLGINTFQNNSEILRAQEDAQHLIDQGLTSSNLPDAVKLLLKTQILNKPTVVFPSWYRTIILGCVILGIVLPFRPKVVVGIGRGTSYLRNWRTWYIVVGVTIPTIIFSNFLLPPVIIYIKQLIGTP